MKFSVVRLNNIFDKVLKFDCFFYDVFIFA